MHGPCGPTFLVHHLQVVLRAAACSQHGAHARLCHPAAVLQLQHLQWAEGKEGSQGRGVDARAAYKADLAQVRQVPAAAHTEVSGRSALHVNLG